MQVNGQKCLKACGVERHSKGVPSCGSHVLVDGAGLGAMIKVFRLQLGGQLMLCQSSMCPAAPPDEKSQANADADVPHSRSPRNMPHRHAVIRN